MRNARPFPPGTQPRAASSRRERVAALANRGLMVAAASLLVFVILLASTRASFADRFYPGVRVGDVMVGGMSMPEAAALIDARSQMIDGSIASFSHDGKTWSATLSEIGVTADAERALREGWNVGREDSALGRVRSALGLVQDDRSVALPLAVDQSKVEAWFDRIDTDLGGTPSNAALSIEGTIVTVVPEREGVLVDRPVASAALLDDLVHLSPPNERLPVKQVEPAVRATDLEPARAQLAQAMAIPVQVRQGGGLWTLPPAEIGRFIVQRIDPAKTGADAFSLSLDETGLAAWLDVSLRPSIDRPARNAEVGWNGQRLISVEPSQNGVVLDSEQLARLVEASFFGNHGVVEAPVVIEQPAIDSNDLGKLGITTLLATGSSNYDGSGEDRAFNVQLGAKLLNGTLIPPKGEFSFNHSIGYIDGSTGFAEAQVIAGERIGTDFGGGICQVSTTVFRAAYRAGMPITEWWPHRFRIGFYEYDGWAPGLDASIMQPSADTSTWDDFRFYNPTDDWLLVESWADGVNVVVNLYGPETGFQVQAEGPFFGQKTEPLGDTEVVDPELEPGSITEVQVAAGGQEVAHYRRVFDGDGKLLWEEPFYTKFYPRGNIWKVSSDMKGLSPAEPDRKIPPMAEEERGKPLNMGAIAWEIQSGGESGAGPAPDVWTEPAAETWSEPAAQDWSDPAAETWTAPAAETWGEPEVWTEPAVEEWVAPSSEGWSDPGTGEWADPAAQG
jgi:vancomycin resistance protein YoaR